MWLSAKLSTGPIKSYDASFQDPLGWTRGRARVRRPFGNAIFGYSTGALSTVDANQAATGDALTVQPVEDGRFDTGLGDNGRARCDGVRHGRFTAEGERIHGL